MITKEDVLAHTTTYDILDFFTSEYRQGRLVPGRNFQNPLIMRTQKTPSFNVYRSDKNGQFQYKDPATGDGGTAFDFVMEKYGLNLPDACSFINRKMNLGISGGKDVNAEKIYKPEPVIYEEDDRNYSFRTYPKPWSRRELEFWGQAGIVKKVLDFLQIRSISRFWAYNKKGEQYEIKAKYNNPMFEYVQNGWSKIYLPFANSKYLSKFYILGRKDPYYIFGIDKLPKSGDVLAVCGGEKDAASWIANRESAISFGSESCNPELYPSFVDMVNSGRFRKIVFIYDNDETGIREMKKNAKKFGAEYWIPPGDGNGEDLFDYFKAKINKV